MTLRKNSINNSAKVIPPTNSSPSENSHDHKPNTVSTPKKQPKKFSQINKKYIKDFISGEGFTILK